MSVLGGALALLLAFGPTVTGPPDDKEPSESHCVAYVIDQAPDGELSLSDWECFDSVDAADARVASLQGVAVEPGQSRDDFNGLLMSFTLGRHYDGYNGTGSSLSVVGSSCTGGWWNTPSHFDNKTSSSFHGCPKLVHYDNANKGGASWTTTGLGTTQNLTSFNNRTESVQYLP